MIMEYKPAVCFITNELFPLGPGGIGRMLFNFAKYNQEQGAPVDIHYLLPQELLTKEPNAPALLLDTFGESAQFHYCPSLDAVCEPLGGLLARSPKYPYTLEWHYAKSYGYYLGLLEAEHKRGAPFDIIEFPDFGGWAVATIEAKRAGLSFTDTLISARIHSTHGIINREERFAHHPGSWNGLLFDSERQLLKHADIIVGHDRNVVAFNELHYGFQTQWQEKKHLEFPPISLEEYEKPSVLTPFNSEDDPKGGDPDFLFSTRLQTFKRPDIFVRAAIAFLEKHSSFSGLFRIVSYGWDQDYINSLQSLVPSGLTDQIPFIFRAAAEERDAYIKRSIVVIPSHYESLCLFAYEAGQMGRKVILNAKCPAFGESERWHDGQNCLLFDGSVEGLVSTMERAIDWQPISIVDSTPDPQYWMQQKQLARPQNTKPPMNNRPGVGLVCYGFESPGQLENHFSSIVHLEGFLDMDSGRDEICFFLPRALFCLDNPEVRRIEERGWRVEFTSGLRECPEMFSHRLAAVQKDYIFLCPAGYEAYPGFLKHGLTAIGHAPDTGLLGGHVELSAPQTAHSEYLRTFLGEAPSYALLSSRIVAPVCFLRRDLLNRIAFDPLAGALWFEVFARQCALKDEKIIVMPMLAAVLNSIHAYKRETTKTISGGLLDELGMSSNLPCRLLTVDPVEAPEDGPDLPFVLEGDALHAIRLYPKRKIRDWEPVGYQSDAGGLLVHPLENHITIAELRGPDRRIGHIVAEAVNTRNDNSGVEAGLALVPNNAGIEDILAIIKIGKTFPGYALSDWIFIEPGATKNIEMSVYGTSYGRDRLLMMSRVPDMGSEINCHLVFRRVEAWFNNNIL